MPWAPASVSYAAFSTSRPFDHRISDDLHTRHRHDAQPWSDEMVVDPRAAEAARVAGMTGEVSQAPLRPPRVARRSPRVDCRVGCGHAKPCGYLFSRVPEALSEPNSSVHSPQCGECTGQVSCCVRWPARSQRYHQGRVSRFEASVTGGDGITGATSPYQSESPTHIYTRADILLSRPNPDGSGRRARSHSARRSLK